MPDVTQVAETTAAADTPAATDPKSLVQQYLDAFEERDLERCASLFSGDATIAWVGGTYSGPDGVRQWHSDRFAANLRLTRLDGITAGDSTATVDAVATSDRLRAWRIGALGGRISIVFDGGKIAKMSFGLRFTNPLA